MKNETQPTTMTDPKEPATNCEPHKVALTLPEGTVILSDLNDIARVSAVLLDSTNAPFPRDGEPWRVLAADAPIDSKEVVYRRSFSGEAIGVPVTDTDDGYCYGYAIFHRLCYAGFAPHEWLECCRVEFDDPGFRIEGHPEWDCIPLSGVTGVLADVLHGNMPTPWMQTSPLPLDAHGAYCKEAVEAEYEEQRKAASASRETPKTDAPNPTASPGPHDQAEL